MMEFRAWPVLLVVLVLLVPSCGGETLHKEHSLGDKAKVTLTDIKDTAVDKLNIVKRSLSAMLSRRLTPRHAAHAPGDGSAAEELRLRTRRELHSFLDSLEPHQLMRLRRAVAASKMNKIKNGNIAGDGLVKRHNIVAPAKAI